MRRQLPDARPQPFPAQQPRPKSALWGFQRKSVRAPNQGIIEVEGNPHGK